MKTQRLHKINSTYKEDMQKKICKKERVMSYLQIHHGELGLCRVKFLFQNFFISSWALWAVVAMGTELKRTSTTTKTPANSLRHHMITIPLICPSVLKVKTEHRQEYKLFPVQKQSQLNDFQLHWLHRQKQSV